MKVSSTVSSAVLGIVAVACISLPSLRADETSDRKKLYGTWTGFVVEGRGLRTDRGPVSLELVITPKGIKSKPGAREDLGEGTFKLGQAKAAGIMDATRTSYPRKGEVYLGIYTIEGDTLKWCTANPGKPRPSEFMTRPSSGQFYMVMKRQKSK